MNTEAYACFSKHTDSRNQSSSGGIYALLAEKVIKDNGIVFAVCYDEKFETIHKEISTLKEVVLSLGSKYTPSRLNDTFRRVKECIKEGHKVLFVGTPCQCEGLRSYINKEYENLICVDFVCHGVPSRNVWRRYLESINSDGNLTSLNMRDKSSGWSKFQYSWRFQYGENNAITIPQSQISYMRGFISDYYLRPSCYECRFKGVERNTDITLGDYWGVWDIQPEMDDNKGTSLVLIHSEKGKKLFNSVLPEAVSQRAILERAIQCNPSIVSSAEKSEKRKEFFEKLQSGEDFEKIMDTMTRVSIGGKVKAKWKAIIEKNWNF